MTETSNCTDDNTDDENEDAVALRTELGPQPLTIMKAR